MEMGLIILIILGGIAFILLEFLLTPGITLLAIVGVGLIVYGIYRSYADVGTPEAHFITLAALVGTTAAVLYGFKWIGGKKIAVHTTMEGRANVIENEEALMGQSGYSVSALRPSGKALIDEAIYEVWSMGEWIEEESPITVIKIKDHKIYVKLKSE